jgi:hypothetical protein
MARLARGVSLRHREPHLLDADLGALSRGDAEVEEREALLAVGAEEKVLHAPRELLDLCLEVLLLADGRPPGCGRGVHALQGVEVGLVSRHDRLDGFQSGGSCDEAEVLAMLHEPRDHALVALGLRRLGVARHDVVLLDGR